MRFEWEKERWEVQRAEKAAKNERIEEEEVTERLEREAER
jgi:hypothetical protein